MATFCLFVSYTVLMRRYLLALLVFVLVGCNLPDPQEAARLKTENESLKAQVTALTAERDAAVSERDDLLGRLGKIKAALENLPVTSSAPAMPETAPVAPETPATPVTPETVTPVVPETPEVPQTPATPVVPETSVPATPAVPDSSIAVVPPANGAEVSAVEKLRVYADEVLTAAQNFKAQTKQEAPVNCVNGYAAGAYNVQDSLDLKECVLVSESNGDYRVTVRDAAGNSVSVP
jgi:hypothetical protein